MLRLFRSGPRFLHLGVVLDTGGSVALWRSFFGGPLGFGVDWRSHDDV